MNRRDYFLQCLNVHLAARCTVKAVGRVSSGYLMSDGNGVTSRGVMEAQSSAWRVPEEAIPADPARAALEFFGYHFVSGEAKPEWLAAWEESLGSK